MRYCRSFSMSVKCVEHGDCVEIVWCRQMFCVVCWQGALYVLYIKGKQIIHKRASPFISIHTIWLRRERKIHICGKYTRHLVFFRQNKYFAFALDIHYILFAVRKETHLNYHHGCWHWSYFSWRWWVNVKNIEIIKKSTEKYWIYQLNIQWNIFSSPWYQR